MVVFQAIEKFVAILDDAGNNRGRKVFEDLVEAFEVLGFEVNPGSFFVLTQLLISFAQSLPITWAI